VEAALWIAYRALEERAALCRRLAERAKERKAPITEEHFRAEAGEVSRQAEILRALLWSGQAPAGPDAAESVSTADEETEGPGQ
jgi:two-component system chemotaxis response regulator CheB